MLLPSASCPARARRTLATRIALAACASAALATSGSAQAARSAPTAAAPGASGTTLVKGPSVEGITEYTLPANGLKVLLFPDPSSPQTAVNITYLVGSRHEGYGETGMAHLLEHLMFKGSPKHRAPATELAAHGAEHNGTTSFDRTNYYEIFPSADTTLVWALDLEADRMVHSFIAKKDLESEFSVVRSEYERGENDPFQVTLKRVLGGAYLFHAYGHLPIGSQSDIENVPIDRLQAFYHRYYEPDNAVLTIAGNFDEQKVLKLVQEKFGRIPRPARSLVATYTVEPAQDGERSATVNRVGDNALVMAYYHMPAGSHPDYAAIDVLTRLMGDPPSGRTYKALVPTKRAAQVSVQNLQLHDPNGLFAFAMLKKGDDVDSAKATLLHSIDELATTAPPTADEVERAKSALAKNFEQTLTHATSLGIELSDWIGMGDWRLFFIHRDRVKAVTVDDVKRVAQLYLVPTNRTVGMFLPTAKPARVEIAAAMNVDSMVRSYKGQAAVARGEVFDPTPANIEKRLKRSTLPSGLQVALLSKKNRGETVNATMNLRFGTEQAIGARGQVAPLVAAMLMRGSTAHTRQQIRDSLDKLKSSMGIGAGGPGVVTVNILSTRQNLPAVLKLAAEVLRQPAFDAAEFEQLRNANVAGAESQRTDPQAIAINAYQRATAGYAPGHPRYIPTPDERVATLKAVTLDDVKKFYSEFYGASHGELAVVGDFDAAEVSKLSADLFGSWKSPAPFKPVSYSRADTAGRQSFETPDKANALFVAGHTFPMKDTDADYPAMYLAHYIMGGTPLASRLAGRIRQKEGLSYIVQSVFSANAVDPVGQFFGVAIYNPVNADKVEAAFFDEVKKARTEGFTADEVAKAKAGLLQERKLARTDDGGLANAIAADMNLGRTIAFDAELDTKIAALTPEQVSETFRKVVDPAKMLVVRAGDFKKAAQAGTPKP